VGKRSTYLEWEWKDWLTSCYVDACGSRDAEMTADQFRQWLSTKCPNENFDYFWFGVKNGAERETACFMGFYVFMKRFYYANS